MSSDLETRREQQPELPADLAAEACRLLAAAVHKAVTTSRCRTPVILVIDEWHSSINSKKGETDE
jgi:hypothetical protein